MSPAAKKKATKKPAAKSGSRVVKKNVAAKKKVTKTAPKKEVKPKVAAVSVSKIKAAHVAPTVKEEPAVKATKPAAASEPKKKEETKTPSKIQGIRIKLSAFDFSVLDEAAMKILDTALRTGAVVHGPIPLPTQIKKFTVNRATFKFKDARDQFEMRIHRRLIDLSETTFKTVDALQNLSLPAGVNIEIKMG